MKCQHKLCDKEAVGETLKQIDPAGEAPSVAEVATCQEHWMVLRETWGLAKLQRLFEFKTRMLE